MIMDKIVGDLPKRAGYKKS